MFFVEAKTNKGQTRRFGMFSSIRSANEWGMSNRNNHKADGPWSTWQTREIEMAARVETSFHDEGITFLSEEI